MKRDYYEVLGVARDSGDDAIRKAYNVLAMKHHPDRNPGDAEAEVHFKLVVEAYAVLRDPQKRQVYDQYGHAGLEGSAGGRGGDDLMDMLREAFNMFGGGRGRSRGPRSGADLQVQFEITLLEAYKGTTREFAVPRHEPCKTCKGTGAKPGTKAVPCKRCNGQGAVGSFLFAQACPACKGKGSVISDPCRDCRGEGSIETENQVKVDVPPGIDDGMSLCVRGEGENGDPGGSPGDLYCQVRVRGHHLFRREGQALHIDRAHLLRPGGAGRGAGRADPGGEDGQDQRAARGQQRRRGAPERQGHAARARRAGRRPGHPPARRDAAQPLAPARGAAPRAGRAGRQEPRPGPQELA